MWDLPRPGLEPVSPALAGRFSTTAPPGKPQEISLYVVLDWKKVVLRYIIETIRNEYVQHGRLKIASNSLTVLSLRNGAILPLPLNLGWSMTALSHGRE